MYTYSLEHKVYLKKIRKEKILINVFRILILFLFLLIWEVLSKYNIINTFLFSSPSRIINTILRVDFIKHISITLYEVFISFILSTFIGIFIAFIMWRFKMFSKVIDPYITIFNSLPKVALGPLFIIWVGASMKSIVFMALTISIFTTIISIYNGFISVNKNYILLLKSFSCSRLQLFRYVILPSNISNIISTLKINISLTLIGVIMGELLVSKMGLGYLIMYGSQVFNLDLVICSIFILGIISYVMYLVINTIEKRLI